MGVSIPYMGNKSWLAQDVAQIITSFDAGPFLDLFAGMCSVAQAIEKARPVWCNEIEAFPARVASVLFKAGTAPTTSQISAVENFYTSNLISLLSRFEKLIDREREALESGQINKLRTGTFNLPFVGNTPELGEERALLAKSKREFPYRLFSLTYAGSYLGLYQCIQTDSLRYGIEKAYSRRIINRSQRDWMIVALGISVIKANNATGHFAQFLAPTSRNKKRVLDKRRRSVWVEFVLNLDAIGPLGTPKWRKNNQCFNDDSLHLLTKLKNRGMTPSVVYADPPYSKAQYSRYYHLLNTLLRYDYPSVASLGRYPSGRFQTPFSNMGTVAKAMRQLVQRTAIVGSDLVLSYPANGLFLQAGGNIHSLLKEYYRDIDIEKLIVQPHSSFGGPKAKPKALVEERIYIARNSLPIT